MKIEIEMTAEDFDRLWVNKMQWQEYDWESQADRFTPTPEFTWNWAYWFDDYASLKMAEAFITVDDCSVHSDEAGGWILLTNYPCRCQLAKTLVSA